MKRLQAMSHRVNRDKTSLASEFVSTLRKKLSTRKHRADLSMSTEAKNTGGNFTAKIKFNSELGYPSENDLMVMIAQSYPTHEIRWDGIDVDEDYGLVTLMLSPSTEAVPISDISQIPPAFINIGCGLYKKAANASGSIQEIWSLKKGDEGLALYRTNDDIELTADDGFKAGDVVQTPQGVGIIESFDDLSNVYVKLGNKIHLICAAEVKPYDIDSEKTKLQDYYENAYGSSTYADKMTEDYSDVFGKSKKKKDK